MKIIPMLLMAGAVTSVPAFAQSPQAEPPETKLTLPSGSVPTQIFGVACKPQDGNANFMPSLMCLATDYRKQPSISVTSGNWKRELSHAQLVDRMREPYHERAMFKVIREEAFVVADDPNALGIRALYETEMGVRFVWALLSRGKMTHASASAYAPADFKTMTADIEAKIFGAPNGLAAANEVIKQ